MKWKNGLGLATLILMVLVAAGLPGCVLVKGALADAAMAKVDGRICGVWKSAEKSNQVLMIGRARGLTDTSKVTDINPEGIMNLSRVSYDPKEEKVFTETYNFFAFTIGDYQYANVIPNSVEYPKWILDKERRSYIIRYQLKDDTLTVWMGDSDAYSALVKAGKLEEGGEALTAYLSKNGGDAIFTAKEMTTYKRKTER